ncbi:DinB family protein [Brevibacillus panacihumi]|uniref:DinB family protein n=1 Tax=Brevibacillus panacihumi TaxID=497735 RepID=UPI003D025E52
MKKLFQYNWQIRTEWFERCRLVPHEDLLVNRVGGAGSILYTLYHIVDVEYSWIRGISGKPDVQVPYEQVQTLALVRELSDSWHQEVRSFIENWSSDLEHELVDISWNDRLYTQGNILRHLIAHEIHHIGQLSIWMRELGIEPVSASLVDRDL